MNHVALDIMLFCLAQGWTVWFDNKQRCVGLCLHDRTAKPTPEVDAALRRHARAIAQLLGTGATSGCPRCLARRERLAREEVASVR